MITNGNRVPRGTFGGIPWAGLIASFSASLLIGLTALTGLLIKTSNLEGSLWVIWAALAGGIFGALLDSLLGATQQAMY